MGFVLELQEKEKIGLHFVMQLSFGDQIWFQVVC